MNNVDKQYLDLMQDILDNGVEKHTRAGDVLSVFGRMMRFNLKEGLPLLTTKKVYTKGIIYELLFFLKGNCTIDYLKENNVHIWDKDCERWDKETGTIMGKLYPYQWRHWGGKIYKGFPDTTPVNIKFVFNDEIEVSDTNSVGKIYPSNYCGDVQLIKYNKEDNTYNIRFINTNYIYTHVKLNNIKNKELKDPYAPYKCGIACTGIFEHNDLNDKLFHLWNDMICRCYDTHNREYSVYGGRGVRVSNDWKCFEYFLRDVKNIENYEEKINNWTEYELDKDSNEDFLGLLYSKLTCKFIKKSENIKLQEQHRPIYTVIDSNNNKYSFRNISQFVIEHNISSITHFKEVLYGQKKSYTGWRLLDKDDLNGSDQIKILIKNLKTNPDDRRLIISAWNVDDFDRMCLYPCHVFAEFYTKKLSSEERIEIYNKLNNTNIDINDLEKYHVPERELSCMYTMRSNDWCAGQPYNTPSYAILTYMLCEVCNMFPGELIYNGGDIHIYTNHIEGAKEQLSRHGSDIIPKLKFKRKVLDIDDFNYDDFEIYDYYPDSTIKYQLNVG